MRQLVFCFCLCLLAGCAGGQHPSDAVSLRELSPEEKQILGVSLAQGLKDPAAAQFKWGPITQAGSDGIAHYCGMVNGKNSFGGYIGYQPFSASVRIVNGKATGGAIIFMGSADFWERTMVMSACKQYGLDPMTAI